MPFKKGVKTVNFSGSNENGFSISNIKIEENGKLREYPAAKWFADFRSLSQPLVGASKGNLSIPFNNASSRAGLRVVVNKTDKPVEMKLVWDNGIVESFPISVRGTSDNVTVPMFNQGKNTKVDLPDAIVDIGKTSGQYVRPMMRRFRSSYDAVKQYVDIVRDWSLLPPASKHPLDIDFVAQPDGSVDMLVDGSFVNRRRLALDTKGEGIVRAELKKANDELNKQKRANAPAAQLAALQATVNKIQNQLDKMPAAKIKSIEIIGNGVSEVQAKNTDAWKGINPKYYMLDLSSNPRAKAFANAKSSVKEGLNTYDGVPYLVAKPMDSADVAICKEGQGNWGLEVEEYLGRSPSDGFPSAIHFRVPADAYGTAHVICALDPDPNKDAVLTTRMGFYMNNGSGGNLLGDTFIEIKDGKIPENFKQIGTVELKGKKVPLYKVAIKLATGKIIDLAAREKYLDFEFMGKGWENLQQLDNSMKPSPYSDSAFNIFAVTLEKAPAVMDIKQHSPGNVFTADERAVTTVALKAKQNNIKGTIVWTAKDVDGKV